jgi:hypothetical protein
MMTTTKKMKKLLPSKQDHNLLRDTDQDIVEVNMFMSSSATSRSVPAVVSTTNIQIQQNLTTNGELGNSSSITSSGTAKSLGKYDVICGRSKNSMDNAGNRRFRDMIALSTSKYSNAPSRAHKSAIIKNILHLSGEPSRAHKSAIIKNILHLSGEPKQKSFTPLYR